MIPRLTRALARSAGVRSDAEMIASQAAMAVSVISPVAAARMQGASPSFDRSVTWLPVAVPAEPLIGGSARAGAARSSEIAAMNVTEFERLGRLRRLMLAPKGPFDVFSVGAAGSLARFFAAPFEYRPRSRSAPYRLGEHAVL